MKLFFAVLTVAVALALNSSSFAADPPAGGSFEAREHKDADGAKLLYQLLEPADYGAEKKHPLLLFLHGAGERGTDNRAQLKWGRKMMQTAADEFDCFVVVPQCPPGQKWVDVTWSKSAHKMPAEPSTSMRLTLQVIETLQKRFSIDADRIYVMGLSMGGYGTWDAVQRWPKMFAAAVPICGGGDETSADRVVTPVWAFHGGSDSVVPVQRSQKMIEALKAAGRKPKYTEYPGVGHNSWSAAFADPELFKWLFAQKRADE